MMSVRAIFWIAYLSTALAVTVTRAVQPAKSAQSATPAEGQPAKEVTDALNSGTTPAAATVEKIMEQAVRNIAVRYNLNEEQSGETRKIMTKGVQQFLREHEDQVWPVIRELLAGGFKPSNDKEQMSRTGKAAQPLLKLAKEAIFKGNEEWRLLLTPDQKIKHDYDLRDMERQFEYIDKNFQEWSSGRYSERSIFPEARLAENEPPRPPKPPKGLPAPELDIPDPNQVFDAIVEDFIKEYELDEGQITAARSIAQEFKANANEYRSSKKAEFAKSLAEQQDARSRRDLDAIKKTWAEYKELLEPINGLCARMEDRLKAQLTSEQIARHEEKVKAGASVGATTTKTEATAKPPVAAKAAAKEPEPVKPDAKSDRDDG